MMFPKPPKKPTQAMRSKERQQRYAKQRAAYLNRNPWCKRCEDMGKRSVAKEVHHKKGKLGDLLFDERYWQPDCPECHRYHHDNPNESYADGYMIHRNWKNDET